MRRITKAALGGFAGCALVLGGFQMASAESAVKEYNYEWAASTSDEAGPKVVDLRLGLATEADPQRTTFDGAYGTLRIKVTPEAITSFKLRVGGIATSAVGTTFGAHLHTDPCDVVTPPPPDGGLGGPHYNHDSVLDNVPIEISRNTEAWFDLVPNDNGVATSDISAPFVPDDSILSVRTNQILGDMSIVIHEKATNPVTGGAGLRQVCLPLSVSQWNTASTE